MTCLIWKQHVKAAKRDKLQARSALICDLPPLMCVLRFTPDYSAIIYTHIYICICSVYFPIELSVRIQLESVLH